MVKALTDYQREILRRLAQGEILYTTHLGQWTPAYKFFGEKGKGVNAASLQKLRSEKLIIHTDKMSMHGQIAFYHLPNQEPWKLFPSCVKYEESQRRLAWRRK